MPISFFPPIPPFSSIPPMPPIPSTPSISIIPSFASRSPMSRDARRTALASSLARAQTSGNNDPRLSNPSRDDASGVESQTAPNARSCGSLMKDTTVLWKLFNLVLSTILLLINIAIYIAFVVIRAIRGPWLYIVLTFILLTIGVIWCHSLCRFIVAVYQYPNYAANRTLQMSMVETAGYAQPDQPIHVTMGNDEERVSENNGTIAAKIPAPPPAYGLWRSSVRLDPDLLHWRRVENQPPSLRNTEREGGLNRKAHGRRPPSYMSDDGVQYVVEAQPRSFTGYSPR